MHFSIFFFCCHQLYLFIYLFVSLLYETRNSFLKRLEEQKTLEVSVDAVLEDTGMLFVVVVVFVCVSW